MNTLLLWIGGLLVAVLGILFAAPYVIDWNAYRGVFEEEASRILGREVRVGGGVNLRLLPSPYVRFEKVRISDRGAALGEPFFRAEAFTLWLSPTPLLRGAIEASELELDRPVLRLAVDEQGRGNWQEIRITPGSIPFVPSDLILQQVRIRSGIVSLKTPGPLDPLTLSGIEGELAASSLDGPYRFRGMIDWYGSKRELRIGTSQREADGRLRYKATVRSPESGNLYTLDGALSELTARARHAGTLTAKLPLSSFFGGIMAGDARARSAKAGETIELQAVVDGDLDGARLSDLAMSFELDGKPQLLSGDILASWRNGLRVETRLASRWLDLDQIAAHEGHKANPVDTVRRLIGQASSMLAPEGSSLLTIDIDQVNLGGEPLSGVRLAMARAGGLTSIGELRGTLPGGAHGELRGSLGATGAEPGGRTGAAPAAGAFDGHVLLRGQSYQRFAAWAGAAAVLAAAPNGGTDQGRGAGDAPFSIDTRLRLMPDGVVASNAQIELGNRQLTAGAEWFWSGQPRLDVMTEGRTIDIGAFAPGALDLAGPDDAPSVASGLAETGSAALVRLAERVTAIERAVGSFRLKLRAGELGDGGTTFRDVDAELAIRDSALTITALKLTGASGARVDLQGELRSLRTRPVGHLRGWLAADSTQAGAALVAALPAGARAIAGDWLARGGRSDIGFAATIGGDGADRLALNVDGSLDGARVALGLKLAGGLARWRDNAIEVSLEAGGRSADGLMRRMIGRGARPGLQGPEPALLENASLQVRAYGANAGSLVTIARLDATGTAGSSTAAYSGRASVTADGDVDLAGDIDLAAPSAADLVLLAGASRRPMVAGTAVRGKLALERKRGTTTLATSDLVVGASRLAGTVQFVPRGERMRLDGQLAVDRLELTGLLGLVLDGQPHARRTEAIAGDGGGREGSPWPDAPFALGLLDGAEGLITLMAPVASLSGELEIAGAEARLAFTPGRLEIQSLTGAALGGRFTGKGTIEAAQAGATVALEARLTGAQLARLAGAVAAAPAGGPSRQSQPGASGDANVTVTLGARALSPRVALATANGRGEIEIRNGRVQGVAAALVENAVLQALEAAETPDRAALERIVRTERSRSQAVIGNRKLPVEIIDGAARIGALEIAAPEADLRNVTTIDLAQLKADSEWQITPRRTLQGPGRAPAGRADPLPAMTFVWTGSLGGIARAEPRMSIDHLERELSIRRMERETEKLEELRRQDEERIRRLEAERTSRDAAIPATPTPAAAPVIEAPLPIAPRGPPGPTTAPVEQPAPKAEPPPVVPRVIRPPPPRARGDARSLQDVFTQQ